MTTSANNQGTAIAHTNIALVKYWGKIDSELTLPYTGSLSLTLDKFYTETKVTFNEELSADKLVVDGIPQDNVNKAKKVLNRVRQLSGIESFAKVESANFVPTSAGFASSASAFAAMAAASASAAGLQLSSKDLSRLARLGSGSASRSVFGGFVEWLPGTDDESSYAYPLEDVVLTDIFVLAVNISSKKKQVSSGEGMKRSASTSPYYADWQKVVAEDLINIKHALKTDDFSLLGQIAEANAMRMHSLTLSSLPPFTYFEPGTLKVIKLVQDLRSHGVECYYTIDAGPNVKVLVQSNNLEAVKTALSEQFGATKISEAKPGPEIELLDN
ncbi:diphosphomevalonate decarboxylase [Lentilactobacillus curieae]|uniref:diphosphomevalonate decarboxylase n=1 Tax=Lentilactobacillus curieae TaxID=1138822 RepID=A0A1S6QKB5_9LACO|nr:diphosphomevalonate decarboxylase [Lentilactobacillus curieae]AQW22072.1 diphosphomevalonate decarboxylase [Lentilactobacillus curieae]